MARAVVIGAIFADAIAVIVSLWVRGYRSEGRL